MMRYLLLLLAACGHPTTPLEGTASTMIASPSCTQISPDFVQIQVEGLTTLAVGNTFDADISIVGAPTTTTVNEFYSCGSWTEVIDGMGQSSGCQRMSGQPISMQAINVSHDEQVTGGSFPVPTMVSITIHVRAAPGSTNVLDVDSTTIACQ